MKIEKLLLGLFASFLMVGCSQNDDAPNASEEVKGKDSYISIKINADPVSRAQFEVGTNQENKVTSVHFFFFDNDGNAFPVPVPEDAEGNVLDYIDEDASSANYIKANPPTISENQQGSDNNIERIMDAVVVFKVENNTYPSGVIAVLNWDYIGAALNKTELMTKLLDETAAIKSSNGFLMSNSVYMKENYEATIDVKSINEQNFATTPDAAKANGTAIELYVERLAVKVKATINTNAAKYVGNDPYPTFEVLEAPTNMNNQASPTIYAQLLAWDINTTANTSYLVKQLASSSTWNATTPFASWNDYGNKRSYYASAVNSGYTSQFTWGDISNEFGSSDYCLENTINESTKQTNVLVKARLVTAATTTGTDGASTTTYTPVTVCQWYGVHYAGIDALKSAVANRLSGKIYEETSTGVYEEITGTSISVNQYYGGTHTSSKDAYKVTFSIPTTVTKKDDSGNETTETKKWYKKNNDGTYTEYNTSSEDFLNLCGSMMEANVWKDGATYYFTKIKHEGNLNAVIRNHYYNVVIEGVNGLGTPVYYPGDTPGNINPDPEPTIPEPVLPGDTETYIAAKINVLSWKLVSNSVVLGQ